MPELPEVETTCRGIAPHVVGKTVTQVWVRQPKLRWPVPTTLNQMKGQPLLALHRRAKYLLFQFPTGTAIVHLGMSGSLRMVAEDEPARVHDHVDLGFDNGMRLRFTDPRRFGAWLWTKDEIENHNLINHLGPEPLGPDFDAAYLKGKASKRRTAVKSFIMDGKVVVGVGNIYANEALFMAGIHPTREAGRISLQRYDRLVSCIRQVLQHAIDVGGTTLRDFVGGDGQPGYFKQSLQVYGRGGEPCRQCKNSLTEIRLGQRTTVFCRHCQR